MRDKVLFFILGAVLATIAYFIGSMNRSGSNDEVTTFEKLHIEKSLTVGDSIIVGFKSLDDWEHNIATGEKEPNVFIVADADGAMITMGEKFLVSESDPENRIAILVGARETSPSSISLEDRINGSRTIGVR